MTWDEARGRLFKLGTGMVSARVAQDAVRFAAVLEALGVSGPTHADAFHSGVALGISLEWDNDVVACSINFHADGTIDSEVIPLDVPVGA